MSNPLYQQYGQNDFMKQFDTFRQSFSGNPQQIIQNMLNSGRISQEQLNQAMQKANSIMKMMR